MSSVPLHTPGIAHVLATLGTTSRAQFVHQGDPTASVRTPEQRRAAKAKRKAARLARRRNRR